MTDDRPSNRTVLMNKSTAHTSHRRYVEPGWFTRNLLNRSLAWLTRRGLSVAGTRELRIVGRTSGEVRSNVVNLLEVDGRRYLVSPRGHTQWVRNLRVASAGELRVGRQVEAFDACELADADKPLVLQAYLGRWGWEVGQFFDGLDRDSTIEDLMAVAADFPVFVVEGPVTPAAV